MAWISLATFLIFVYGLADLIVRNVGKRSDPAFASLWTPWAIVVIVLLFSLSLLWTRVDFYVALSTLVKHGKLLEILILISLIRTRHEARIAVTAFAASQAILLLTSWLMAVGISIPWATSVGFKFVVFSTYLDQSIIFATTAAIFWHLWSEQQWRRWLAALLAAGALINVFLLLEGRTGYAVAMTVLSLAVMWAAPKRWRLLTLLGTPVILLFGLYMGSAQVQNRLYEIVQGSQGSANQDIRESSTEWRLNAWHRSLEAIEEEPWWGHGVGSWTTTIKQLEGDAAPHIYGTSSASNPHQEYLLWGVELGIGGTLLLLALIASIMRDALTFKRPIARATISVVAALAVACMFNSALYDSLIGDFFRVTLGLLIALGVRSAQPSPGQLMSEPDLKV